MNPLPNPSQLLHLYEDSKKVCRKYGLRGLISVAVFAISYLLYLFLSWNNLNNRNPYINPKINIQQSGNVQIYEDESKSSNRARESVEGVSNEIFNPDEWTIKNYDSSAEDGFLCPSFWSKFSSPEIWNNKLIPVNFRRITVYFEIKNKNKNETGIPTIIFSLGDQNRVLRFYTPQKTRQDSSPQYVGFQKVKPECNESWGECNWEPPQNLNEPIATGIGKAIILQVDSQYKEENKLGYVFTLNYPSAKTFKNTKQVFPYDVIIPAPDLSLFTIKWGIGTFKDSCFKVNSFKVVE